MRKRGPKTVTLGQNPIAPPEQVGHADLDYLFSVTYEELRRLAAAVRSGDPGATMNPTALVHEAWLKLVRSPGVVSTSRLHFKRIAARAMRQLLVESARRRHSQKRGGGVEAVFVTFDEALGSSASCGEDVLRLLFKNAPQCGGADVEYRGQFGCAYRRLARQHGFQSLTRHLVARSHVS